MAKQAALPGIEKPEPWVATDKMNVRGYGNVRVHYTLVDTPEKLATMVATCVAASVKSHDTETSGLSPALGARIIGHAFSAYTGKAEISTWYVPIRHVGDHQVDKQLPVDVVNAAVEQILTSPGCCYYAHAKFDLLLMQADGIVPTIKIHDVLVAANVANENEPAFALKALSTKYVCANAKNEASGLDKWLRSDARSLGLPFRKRRKVEVGDVNTMAEPTYMERFAYARTPISMCGRYACRDVLYTIWLGTVTYANIPTQWQAVYEREMACMYHLLGMQTVGLPVDVGMIRENHDKTGRELVHWLGECRRLSGKPEFSATDDELRRWWYEDLGMDVVKWTKGGQSRIKKKSVDHEAREILKCRYPQHVELLNATGKLSDALKFYTTYSANFLKHLAADGRIRPSYNQLDRREGGVPVTGRLSSSEPNIQNVAYKPLHFMGCRCEECSPDAVGVPDLLEIRRYFTVPDGYIRAYIDFSQIELRVLAWFCQDPNLLRAYREGLDVHQMTADLLSIVRKVAKQVNFGNSYGMTEIGLALRMPGYYQDPEGTRGLAKVVLVNFFEKYRAIKQFERAQASLMRRNSNMMVNPFGRPRRIDWISSPIPWQRRRAERQMMSSIISGTAADLMKECILRTAPILKAHSQESHLVQSIHDELVFDIKLTPGWADTLSAIMRAMEDWPMFSAAGPGGAGDGVPIEVTCELTRTTWADKAAIKHEAGTFSW